MFRRILILTVLVVAIAILAIDATAGLGFTGDAKYRGTYRSDHYIPIAGTNCFVEVRDSFECDYIVTYKDGAVVGRRCENDRFVGREVLSQFCK